MKRPDKLKETILSFLPSILAIVVGLLFGFVILLISNPGQALGGGFHNYNGCLSGYAQYRQGNVLRNADCSHRLVSGLCF